MVQIEKSNAVDQAESQEIKADSLKIDELIAQLQSD
jgi:hypothetical protein